MVLEMVNNSQYEYGYIHDALLVEVDAMVREGRKLVLGEEIVAAERALAEYAGCARAVAVGSGSDALYLALRSIGVSGTEVILPANVCVSLPEAILRAGATPRFVDVRPDTWTLDPDLVSATVQDRIGAIIAVHVYGLPADLDALVEIADSRGIALLEAAGQAFGARYRERPVGHWGTAGCYSFNPSKMNGAIGDGGALVTDDEALALRAHRTRDHGRDVEGGTAHFVGMSSRLDEINALVVRLKLQYIDEWVRRRHARGQVYRELLSGVDGVTLQAFPPGRLSSVQRFSIRVPTSLRDRIRERLAERGIRTGGHYVPPYRMPAFESSLGISGVPVTESLAASTMSLPFYPEMTDGAMEFVVEALRDALGGT